MANQIHTAICAMLADVEAIKKDRKNQQQGYSFRGIDDVYNAVHPLLAKHKVFPACEIVSKEISERQTKAGGALFCVSIKAKYTFYAEDGSSIATEALGDGMDSADKASNKAMSAAYKYALFQLLCIPTEAVDSEADDVPPVAPAKRQADKVASSHGMTTAEKLPAKSAFDTATETLPKADTIAKIDKFVAWIEGKKIEQQIDMKQLEALSVAAAERAIEICETPEDYDEADRILRLLIGKMRIHDAQGTDLRIKLADAKDAKLGAAA